MSEQPLGEPSAASRLGAAVELPWWAPPALLPPLAVLVGTAIAGPLGGRLAGAVGSLGLVAVVVRVSTRVRSRNLQSVWVSTAYGFWFFFALVWVVSLAHG